MTSINILYMRPIVHNYKFSTIPTIETITDWCNTHMPKRWRKVYIQSPRLETIPYQRTGARSFNKVGYHIFYNEDVLLFKLQFNATTLKLDITDKMLYKPYINHTTLDEDTWQIVLSRDWTIDKQQDIIIKSYPNRIF